jgi:hypothetical protein
LPLPEFVVRCPGLGRATYFGKDWLWRTTGGTKVMSLPFAADHDQLPPPRCASRPRSLPPSRRPGPTTVPTAQSYQAVPLARSRI